MDRTGVFANENNMRIFSCLIILASIFANEIYMRIFSCLIINLASISGEYSADDAWEFQELEEQITKGYM